MSKTAQVTLWLLFACILVVVISVALVTIDLDRITEKAIEAYGTEAAGVAVSVADADVSIGERQARIDGVKVESPPGFLSKHVLGFGTIDVALNVEASNEDLVVIACLIVNDAHITIENSARGQTNLEIILENLESNARDNVPARHAARGLKYIIEKLVFRGGELRVVDPSVDLDVAIAVPDLRLTSVGQDSGGATALQIRRRVAEAFVRTAMAGASDQLPQSALVDLDPIIRDLGVMLGGGEGIESHTTRIE